MSKYEENLISSSIPFMEVVDEKPVIDYDIVQDAEVRTDIVDIVDNLGEEDFKFIFLNLYDEIYTLPEDKQKELCEKLELEFSKIYSFEFTPKLDFESTDDRIKFLNFIEFIEFENVEFFANVIKGFDIELLKKDLNNFISTNLNSILEKIEKMYENEKISELISIFFRTNNKMGILDFIRLRIERNKMLIILKSMEGEFQNE